MAADPVETDSSHYRVVFENDRVRVLHYQDEPGDRTHPHFHPDSVMITMTSFDRRLRDRTREMDVELSAGQVRWLDAQEHSGENIGQSNTKTFFVELKEDAPQSGQVRLGPRTG